jgi:GTPase SAR1 family protein
LRIRELVLALLSLYCGSIGDAAVTTTGSDERGAVSIVLIVLILLAVAVGLSLLGRWWARQKPESPESPLASSTPITVPSPTFRVVALGGSGAGKTVFLSTMFHELNFRTSRRSYYLETTPEQAIALGNIYARLTDPAQPWPKATLVADSQEYVFDCVGRDPQGNRRKVLTLSFVDYAGGLLERHMDGASHAFQDLQKRIDEANALLVMIDGYRIRQLFENHQAARTYFLGTIRPMLEFAQRATCPIHFVLTKWDLVCEAPALHSLTEGERQDRVVAALMQFDFLKALVYVHSSEQVVRVIPVSSVGASFAEIDSNGFVVKRPHGTVAPTNVDVPLSVIVPDYFKQVRASLDTATRDAVEVAVRSRLNLKPHEWLGVAASVLAQPAGLVVRTAFKSTLGGDVGQEVSTLFLRWLAGPYSAKNSAIGSFRDQAEQEVASVEAVRSAVLEDFTRVVHRFEDSYPKSLLRMP